MKNSTRNKNMKKAILVLFSLVSAVGVASASNNFSYTATASPGNNPDGVDQALTPLQVWTLTTTPGFNPSLDGSGAYYGSQPSLGNAWQLYSYQNSGVGNGGSAFANTTFAGGALSIGQTVSINFNMRAVDPGKQVGLSLLNGSGNAITFGIFGGEPNVTYPYTGSGYYYTDAGSSYASAGSMGYQYQSYFNIEFTVTGAGTYSAVAGSDSWSGTYSGSLIGMQAFDAAAGNGSDVGFNNLTITTVPEPSTLAMLALGSVGIFGWRRISRRA
jgi:hypothetical protein